MTPWLDDGDIRLYHGDALETVRELPDRSVDCVVTSPPYWGLRDYGIDGQMGLEPTPDLFVAGMVELFREIRRVLAPHGTCWVNLGDSYASQGDRKHGGWNGDSTYTHGPQRIKGEAMGAPMDLQASGLKVKDLVGAPWRVAFALQQDGWYLRSDIVWAKPNPMPESVTDRPTKSHEFVFLLTKAPWKGREPGPIEARLSAEDARWLALMLDAEGNISVKRVAPKDGKSPQYGAQIAIGSTSRPLLERVAQIAGTGNILERQGTNAPMFYWQVSNKVAQDLLYAVYPHLIVKPRQARIAIHLESLLYHRGHATHRTDAENATLESLWLRNKECNQFGAPDLADVPEPKYGKWGATRYWFDTEAVREPVSQLSIDVHSRCRSGGSSVGKKLRSNIDRGETPENSGLRNGTERDLSGRNVRSVWQIVTQPYPDAHFATFPEELARRCILAGCPVRVCRVCGKPSERIVEAGPPNGKPRKATEAWNAGTGLPLHRGHRGTANRDTVGWSDCGHNAWRAGRVLDPFIGSGTTAKVARDHQRHAIGIDLNAQYLELAARRLQQLSLLT